MKKNLLNDKEDKDITLEAEKKVSEAWQIYQNIEAEKAEEIFNYTYSHLSPELEEQRDFLRKEVK